MYKLVVLSVAVMFCGVYATPGNLLAAPLAYSSPLVAAPLAYTHAGPVVTAHSSQVVSQRFHGVAAPLLAPAPVLAAYAHAPVPVLAPFAHAPAAVYVK